jgi:hypothetical protein
MLPPRSAQLYQPASTVHINDSRLPSAARANTFIRVSFVLEFDTAAGPLDTVTADAFNPIFDQFVVHPPAPALPGAQPPRAPGTGGAQSRGDPARPSSDIRLE